MGVCAAHASGRAEGPATRSVRGGDFPPPVAPSFEAVTPPTLICLKRSGGGYASIAATPFVHYGDVNDGNATPEFNLRISNRRPPVPMPSKLFRVRFSNT